MPPNPAFLRLFATLPRFRCRFDSDRPLHSLPSTSRFSLPIAAYVLVTTDRICDGPFSERICRNPGTPKAKDIPVNSPERDQSVLDRSGAWNGGRWARVREIEDGRGRWHQSSTGT